MHSRPYLEDTRSETMHYVYWNHWAAFKKSFLCSIQNNNKLISILNLFLVDILQPWSWTIFWWRPLTIRTHSTRQIWALLHPCQMKCWPCQILRIIPLLLPITRRKRNFTGQRIEQVFCAVRRWMEPTLSPFTSVVSALQATFLT